MKLTAALLSLHRRTVQLGQGHRRLEAALVDCLIEVDRTKLFKKLGHTSLFNYCVKELSLGESTSYALISVARKCATISELKMAVGQGQLCVSKANRIASCVNESNARELIEFARKSTQREIDQEVARRNPKAGSPDRAKPLSSDIMKLEASLPNEVYAKLKRAQSIVSTNRGKSLDFSATLDEVLEEYLQRHDPVTRAERAKKTSAKSNSVQNRVRKPLTSSEKHAVNLKFQGRCGHVDASGERCTNDRWLHIHHIHPIHLGGSNDSENLMLLCSAHHDLVHQYSFPIEGQMSWLKSRVVPYQAASLRRSSTIFSAPEYLYQARSEKAMHKIVTGTKKQNANAQNNTVRIVRISKSNKNMPVTKAPTPANTTK